MYFFDTHAHIHRSRDSREVDIGEKLRKARSIGLRALLAPSVDHADWDFLPQLNTVPGVQLYRALGLHPYYVSKITLNGAFALVEELEFRVKNAGSDDPSGLVAIGECGLDFHRARSPAARAQQVKVFRAQLELARAVGLPLSIHCVHAQGPMLELLTERPSPPSAMHAFSGSVEVARQLVAAGHFISFAGNLCVANARRVVETARSVPSEHILIETDSPDQTPPERRPAANEPAFIVDIVARLASLRGRTDAQIAATTLANARRLFGIQTPFALHPIEEEDGAEEREPSRASARAWIDAGPSE